MKNVWQRLSSKTAKGTSNMHSLQLSNHSCKLQAFVPIIKHGNSPIGLSLVESTATESKRGDQALSLTVCMHEECKMSGVDL